VEVGALQHDGGAVLAKPARVGALHVVDGTAGRHVSTDPAECGEELGEIRR